ncbi:MAG: hypothetical protein LBE76_01050 [Nitrososphaerota archaeon]|jgi:hypothetical protein|nr:hypothetical protein [Nitrososphaerota archaeon]
MKLNRSNSLKIVWLTLFIAIICSFIVWLIVKPDPSEGWGWMWFGVLVGLACVVIIFFKIIDVDN